jgi:Na+/proline symporter
MDPQIAQMLRELAIQLKVTTDHLWGVLVYQQYIHGWSHLLYLLGVLPFLGGIAFCIYWLERGRKEKDTETMGMSITVGLLLIIIVGLIFFLNLPEAFTCFYNPEMGALEMLLSMIHKGG